MSEHPNVATVNRMTQAVFDEDHDALAEVFAEGFRFHLRGPFPNAGDHTGLEAFLHVLGTVFEMTGGDIKLDQRFCVATDGWVAEWEQASLGRAGKRLESDNAFVYRFEDARIAEMWMLVGARPEDAVAFFA